METDRTILFLLNSVCNILADSSVDRLSFLVRVKDVCLQKKLLLGFGLRAEKASAEVRLVGRVRDALHTAASYNIAVNC